MPDPHFLYSQLFAEARPCSGYAFFDGHPYNEELPIDIGRLGYTTLETGVWVGLWEVLPKDQCGLVKKGTLKGGQTYYTEGVQNTSVNLDIFSGYDAVRFFNSV